MRNDCEKFIIIVAAQFLNDKNVTNNKMKNKRNRKKCFENWKTSPIFIANSGIGFQLCFVMKGRKKHEKKHEEDG